MIIDHLWEPNLQNQQNINADLLNDVNARIKQLSIVCSITSTYWIHLGHTSKLQSVTTAEYNNYIAKRSQIKEKTSKYVKGIKNSSV